MTPGFSGVTPVIVSTGSFVRRARISASVDTRCGLRCWATTIGAGKSTCSVETRPESASMPPADAPTTMSCEKLR
jgi:hypothetical protein